MTEHSRFTGSTHGDQIDGGWLKADASLASNACVEVARTLPDSVIGAVGDVALRNSREPDGTIIPVTVDEMRLFMDGIRNGDFQGIEEWAAQSEVSQPE
jgi:hypothetical protein